MSRPSPAFLGGCGLLALSALLIFGHPRIEAWRDDTDKAEALAKRQPPVITVRRPASSSEELRQMRKAEQGGAADPDRVLANLVKSQQRSSSRMFFPFGSQAGDSSGMRHDNSRLPEGEALSSQDLFSSLMTEEMRDSARADSEVATLSAEQLRDALERMLRREGSEWGETELPDPDDEAGAALKLDDRTRAGVCRTLLAKLAAKEPEKAFALLATAAMELAPRTGGQWIPDDALIGYFDTGSSILPILTAAAGADPAATVDWLIAHPGVMAAQGAGFIDTISYAMSKKGPSALRQVTRLRGQIWNGDGDLQQYHLYYDPQAVGGR